MNKRITGSNDQKHLLHQLRCHALAAKLIWHKSVLQIDNVVLGQGIPWVRLLFWCPPSEGRTCDVWHRAGHQSSSAPQKTLREFPWGYPPLIEHLKFCLKAKQKHASLVTTMLEREISAILLIKHSANLAIKRSSQRSVTSINQSTNQSIARNSNHPSKWYTNLFFAQTTCVMDLPSIQLGLSTFSKSHLKTILDSIENP